MWCQAQIQLFVPGTNPPVCTRNKFNYLYQAQIQLFVPGTNPPVCTRNKSTCLYQEQIHLLYTMYIQPQQSQQKIKKDGLSQKPIWLRSSPSFFSLIKIPLNLLHIFLHSMFGIPEIRPVYNPEQNGDTDQVLRCIDQCCGTVRYKRLMNFIDKSVEDRN
jgi:hypothetical protein